MMATREPFYGRELPVTLARTPGEPPEERLSDLVYVPLLDGDGNLLLRRGRGLLCRERWSRARVERRVRRMLRKPLESIELVAAPSSRCRAGLLNDAHQLEPRSWPPCGAASGRANGRSGIPAMEQR